MFWIVLVALVFLLWLIPSSHLFKRLLIPVDKERDKVLFFNTIKNNKYKLDEPTKKSYDISIFTIKGKHPIDYNIDSCKKEDFNDVVRLLDEIINLNESPEFEDLTYKKNNKYEYN